MQVENAEAPTPEVLSVAKFLRGHLKPRGGVLHGRRVDFFKGKSAKKVLLSDKYKHKSRPPVASAEDAERLLHQCIYHGMFLGCEKEDRTLNVLKQQSWSDDTYYVWLYQGSQAKQVLGGIALVAVVMAGVMFPLWPPIMRNGVWYLSVGVLCLLGLFFLLAVFRLFFYVITLIVARPGIWIFPNLFEDVGVVESFTPLWAWDVPPPPKRKKVPASVAPSSTVRRPVREAGATSKKEGTVEIEGEDVGDWDDETKDIEEKKVD